MRHLVLFRNKRSLEGIVYIILYKAYSVTLNTPLDLEIRVITLEDFRYTFSETILLIQFVYLHFTCNKVQTKE